MKVIKQANGSNREMRRGRKYRNLSKQTHLQGKAQARMMFASKGLIKS